MGLTCLRERCWPRNVACLLAFEVLQGSPKLAGGQIFDAKHNRIVILVESHRGSDGPFHVISYYNYAFGSRRIGSKLLGASVLRVTEKFLSSQGSCRKVLVGNLQLQEAIS